jgi:hypothetical protein
MEIMPAVWGLLMIWLLPIGLWQNLPHFLPRGQPTDWFDPGNWDGFHAMAFILTAAAHGCSLSAILQLAKLTLRIRNLVARATELSRAAKERQVRGCETIRCSAS